MKLESVDHIAIVGTGMIGAGMAALFTGNGYRTTLCARNDAGAARARNLFDTYYADLVRHGLATRDQARRCATYLSIAQDYTAIQDADFIFECVVEQLPAKHAVYAEIERHCTCPRAIVSATSSIAADDLTEGLATFADRLLVAHPFNPPHLVPFVECLRASATSDDAMQFTRDVLESVGRQVATVLKSAPGFIANRLQHALVREAVYMIETGITTAEDVDKALTYSFAPRYTSVGLLQHQDYAGLDLVRNIQENVLPALCNGTAPQQLIVDAVERGDLGAKTGRGLHDWTAVDMDAFREAESAPYYRFFNWSLPSAEATALRPQLPADGGPQQPVSEAPLIETSETSAADASSKRFVSTIAEISEVRFFEPERIAELLSTRCRRTVARGDGRLMIVACDHPARGALGASGKPMAMANRTDLLERLVAALSRPGVDGLLATADIAEDLLLLGVLEGKLVFSSINRGGIQGSVFEIDDRNTGYDVRGTIDAGFDGAKMLTRIDLDDPATVATLEAQGRVISELNRARLVAMVEPFLSRRVNGRVTNDLSPDAVIKSIAIASGLGASSAYTWMKVPVVADMERVMTATTLPTLLLGGDPNGDPAETYAAWQNALALPAVRGLILGRTMLYPADDDVAKAVDAAVSLVH